MRIVHISDCYLPRLGGIEQQVSGLARAQSADGHEVHVITATRHNEVAEELIDGVQVHRLTAPLPLDLPLHPRAGVVIHERLGQLEADIVHVHLGSVSQFAWAGLRAADALSLPCLTSVHSMWGPFSRMLYAVARRFLNWPRTTRLTAVSAAAAALVRRAAHVEVGVIGNGIDLSGWQAAERSPQSVLRLVSATRFSPRKRVLPLLLAMRRLQRVLGAECPRITIAGTGSFWPLAKLLVDWLGLGKVVDLPGRLDRAALAALYAEADLYVQLSVRESFGLAAIEARAAGLPVIGRIGTGFTEFVEPDVTGLLVASDAAAVRAIVDLHRDREALLRLQSASLRLRPLQTWQAMTAQVESAYAQALNDLR